RGVGRPGRTGTGGADVTGRAPFTTTAGRPSPVARAAATASCSAALDTCQPPAARGTTVVISARPSGRLRPRLSGASFSPQFCPERAAHSRFPARRHGRFPPARPVVGQRVRHVQGRARRARAALAAVLTWAGLLTGAVGCTADSPLSGAFGPPAAEDVIRVTPDDGSRNVRPDRKLRVRVPDGRLESVKVVKSQDAQKSPVPGRVSADGLTWRPDEDKLALAAEYTVDAVAVDGSGRRSARHTTFTTHVPEERFIGYVAPENRSTVGTGMIVSLEFNRKITHRAAVERAVRVTSSPAVDIRPHWFGRSRLDFRPEHYWKPGTRVTVELGLLDVEGAPGVYGLQQRTLTFPVGRSQVSRVDASRHTMQVRRDGDLLATVPVTAGAPKTTTYNGTMVITE